MNSKLLLLLCYIVRTTKWKIYLVHTWEIMPSKWLMYSRLWEYPLSSLFKYSDNSENSFLSDFRDSSCSSFSFTTMRYSSWFRICSLVTGAEMSCGDEPWKKQLYCQPSKEEKPSSRWFGRSPVGMILYSRESDELYLFFLYASLSSENRCSNTLSSVSLLSKSFFSTLRVNRKQVRVLIRTIL